MILGQHCDQYHTRDKPLVRLAQKKDDDDEEVENKSENPKTEGSGAQGPYADRHGHTGKFVCPGPAVRYGNSG